MMRLALYLLRNKLRMYECTNLFTVHHTLKIAHNIHLEYIDGKVVLLTH